MAFIAKADLYTAILQEELEEITRTDNTIINQCIDIAISEIRGYLFDSFDLDVILAKTGTNRNGMLVNCAVDIAVYVIVSRCQQGVDMRDRKDRYDRAKSWLKMIQKSELFSDLERRETTQQDTIAYGSNEKRSNYY